jgi:hypothetical protein
VFEHLLNADVFITHKKRRRVACFRSGSNGLRCRSSFDIPPHHEIAEGVDFIPLVKRMM